MKRKFGPLKAVGILLIVSAVFSVLSYVVMLLWNNVLAVVTHVGLVTFWQAAGILLLSKILFGFGGRPFKGRHNPGEMAWKRQMMGKWQNMTPEERIKFKDEFKSRCMGGWRGDRRWGNDFERQEEKQDGGVS